MLARGHRLLLRGAAVIAAVSGCTSIDLSSPASEKGNVEIVGLPDPLVFSQTNLQGNLYVQDQGLGWTADGREVVHVIGRYGDVATDIRRISTLTKDTQAVRSELPCVWSLSTSPDGESLAFVGSDAPGCPVPLSLFVGRALDYALAPVDSVDSFLPYAWSPDSRLLAYPVAGGGIVVRDLESNNAVATIAGPGAPLAFSPDGDRLLVGQVGDTALELSIRDVATGAATGVGTVPVRVAYTPNWSSLVVASWGQTGFTVVYVRGNLGTGESIESFDLSTGTTTVLAPASVLNSWRLGAISPDGKTLAAWLEEWIPTSILTGYQRSHLYLIDLNSRRQTLRANASGDTYGGSVAFSPDQTQLAFYYTGSGNETEGGGIYLLGYP